MEMPEVPRPLSTYLNTRLTCSCGRQHYAPLKRVSIRRDALQDLPLILKELGCSRPFLICDAVTEQIAGEACRKLLLQSGIQASCHVLSHANYDEATLGELLISKPDGCDIAVAVGTGAINDMTRFFSFRLNIPFMTVATAAPMDGFASSVAVLQVDHMKTTFEAQTPSAILGDTEILKNAPYRMIAAGMGDLLGKVTCLCDWKLAHLITGEHYCENIVELVENCVRNALADADKVRERDPEALGSIMEGLVLSGVAISLYGNSRPASGCEHHMSHYWEMMFEQAGKRPVPHGLQVGVGTVLILKLAKQLLRTQVDFAEARSAARTYDPAVWEESIRSAYGLAAGGIIALERSSRKNETSARLKRIDVMEAHWNEIAALLEALPPADRVMDILRSLGAPCLPDEIGVDRALLKCTFLYCKETRARYTLLQMAWDLGLLDTLSDEVIAELAGGDREAAPEPARAFPSQTQAGVTEGGSI